MKFNQALNNFSAGEWSPKMKGRTDVQQYPNACEELINFMPQVQGGVFRRPPTKKVPLGADYLTDLGASSGHKLFSRYLSNGVSEMLIAMESAPATTWFVIDGPAASGRVINSVDTFTTAGTDANFTGSPTSYIQVGDLLFMVNATTGAGSPPRVWSGVSGSDRLSNLQQFIHTGPAVGHGNYKAMPYLPVSAGLYVGVTALTITASSVTFGASVTLTASAAYFNSGHVGTYFKFNSGGITGVVRILTFTNTTTVLGVVVVTLPLAGAYGAAAGTSWEEGAWSDYRGWPRTVTAYQGRLIFGGSKTYPDTIWGSRIGNVLDFMERPFEDDDFFDGYTEDNSRPFTLTPNTGTVGYITTMSAAKTLLIHTDKNEIVAYGTNGALGPNDVTFESSTSFGANRVPAVRSNNYSVFVDRTGRKLRDVTFNFDEGQYTSSDLTFLADHLTVDKIPVNQRTSIVLPPEELDPIVEIVSLTQNSTYVICRTSNWKLLGLALDREYKLNAWFQMNIAGKHPVVVDKREFAPVYAIGSLNTSNGDELYMVTGRMINGTTITRLERMLLPNELSEVDVSDPASYPITQGVYHCDYLSTGLITLGDSTINVGTDFALEVVELFIAGKYLGSFTPSASGIITLGFTQATTEFWAVGFPYTSKLKIMPVELGQQIPGSSQGLIKRIDEITIRFWNTLGAKYGYKESDMSTINFREPTQIDADPVSFFTGLKVQKMASNYTNESQVIVIQDKPWPCNVLSIVAKGQTYD